MRKSSQRLEYLPSWATGVRPSGTQARTSNFRKKDKGQDLGGGFSLGEGGGTNQVFLNNRGRFAKGDLRTTSGRGDGDTLGRNAQNC